MIDVTLEQAHAEACQALAEAVIMQRILAREIQRLTAENAKLQTEQE